MNIEGDKEERRKIKKVNVMRFNLKSLLLLLWYSCQFAPTVVAQDSTKAPSVKANNGASKTWDSFQEMRRKYRLGELNDSGMWAQLMSISSNLLSLPPAQQATILQAQASVLKQNGFPILAAINAAQAIQHTKQPLDDEFKRSWTILKEVSLKFPIQNLLEDVADHATLNGELPAAFNTEWNYIEGNSNAKSKQPEKALAAYAAVKITDRYFFPSKYQQAMIYLDSERFNEAIASLNAIIYPTSQDLSTLSKKEKALITDDANMALGRIYYERKQFNLALKHYRFIGRSSEQFYEALFEQSWALFMAGYPNHALGMLYGVRSPFFRETFNPEATMLAAIIYYWICRYDDSRNELADFIEYQQSAIKGLDDFLSRKSLNEETAYALFENTVTGVSSEGLGMPRTLLNSAAQKDSMMYVRDQYASVLSELQQLESNGLFSDRQNIDTPRKYLQQWALTLKNDTGRRFLFELQDMRKEYLRLGEQAQFLYVELLMSQKDQLLGKELHGSTKIGRVSNQGNIAGWSSQAQAWATDDKMEYWQDELGFHIFRVQPLCKAN
ncbi:MAG: hypothetical protein NTV34_09495 [Proteobacteria bacterium]|nr:hypothetical protein [Pseudomonadota bacterium]